MKNPLGMRTVKTGIAAGLSILYARIFPSEFPIFIVIAAIVSMNKTVASSYVTGKNRLIGTAFGALTGLIFVLIFPQSNFILFTVGIIIVIAFCNLLHIQEAISLSCIVFSTITLNLITSDLSPIFYSISRFTDTLVGIVIAILVNTLLKPYNNAGKIERMIREVREISTNCLKTILMEKRPPDLGVIASKIDVLGGEITAFESEFFRRKRRIGEINNYKACKSLLGSLLIEVTALSQLDRFPFITTENQNGLVSLDADFVSLSIETKEEAHLEDTVFNFHLDRFLNIHSYLTDYMDFSSGKR